MGGIARGLFPGRAEAGMIALIIAAGALALLYFWLIGHWFARVLMCIVFWPIFIAVTFGILSAAFPGPIGLAPDIGILVAIVGVGLSAAAAWKVSGYPTRYRIKAGYPVTLYREGQTRPWFTELYEGFIRDR
jgi:hypothetical protein